MQADFLDQHLVMLTFDISALTSAGLLKHSFAVLSTELFPIQGDRCVTCKVVFWGSELVD